MSIRQFIHSPRWRTLLVLGRVSNLPTLWSNCLAAWLLGGDGDPALFAVLLAGTSLMYTGGMFLNDAFDADFDRQHRRDRPIPSGRISLAAVWNIGFSLLGAGTLLLTLPGKTTAILALLLAGCILLYDSIHKLFEFSVFIIAACRFLVYLLAASVSEAGVTGIAVWSALALAAYVTGLSYLARRETIKSALRHWPLAVLGAPLVLAAIVNTGRWAPLSLWFSLALLAWILYCLRFTLWASHRQLGRTVSGLLAGIVLVDCLAVLGGGGIGVTVAFLALFLLALLFQKFIPAT